MSPIIFFKQSYRGLKKQWSVITLIFLFLAVGVSLIVGLSAYLFNAHELTINTAFKNGSQDAKINSWRLAWSEDTDTPDDHDILFSDQQKEKFRSFVGTQPSITDQQKEKFYKFLIEKGNGYVQSFLYQSNDFFTDEDKQEPESKKWKEWTDWVNQDKFKWFNGNALAYYFKGVIKSVDWNWDVRTTDLVGTGNNELGNDGILKAYLENETKFIFSTFDERWIAYQFGQRPKPSSNIIFNHPDFNYQLKVSYAEYSQTSNPIFLAEKNLRDFHLKIGDKIDISNTLLPINAKTEKYKIVGTFYDTGSLINFSDTLSGAVSFSHFWELIQSQENYLEFPFYITTNQKDAKNYASRFEEIQRKIESTKMFSSRDGPNSPLSITDGYSIQYWNVIVFWKTNIAIIILCIVGGSLLIFFVILFTTKQLIQNNKPTLQFLKSLGMNNFELSLINMAIILLPMLLGFIVSIPGFFIIQNLYSFILEMQYPMILNFWMWNFQTIFIFLGVCFFAIIVFFFTNFMVLKKHNILERKQSKLINRIKDGRIRNFVYSHVSENTRIGLAISGANFRKNLVTFCLLLVTFSVILFGVGFRGSINHQAHLAQSYFFPYKSYSTVEAPLFTEKEDSYGYTQAPISQEMDLTPITADMSFPEIAKILTSNLKSHYLTAQTIDVLIGSDFEKFMEDLEKALKDREEPKPVIDQALKMVRNLYVNYQMYKLQLEKLYSYTGDFRFIFGRFVPPTNLEGAALNLKIKINERVNGKLPPNQIHSIGLIGQNIKDILDLHSRDKQIVEVKISQQLANKLNITKTELAFKKPIFKFNLTLTDDWKKTISVPAKVIEIIKADFTQNDVYYSFNNLQNYLRTLDSSGSDLFAEQLRKVQTVDALNIVNGTYIADKIPNTLLNMTVPIVKNEGLSVADYFATDKSTGSELVVLDFNLIAKTFNEQTSMYINLVNRIISIFIAITIIVSLLLTYLFLVENRQNILLFKSLGYSMIHITRFLISGYIAAAIVAVGLAIGVSVVAVSLLSDVFIGLFGATISFSFTFDYSLLIFFLPVAFTALILVSLWIYIFEQDPKKAVGD